MSQPVISVIIVVKNDRAVTTALDSLAHQQDAPSFETIIIDASTAGFLDDIAPNYPTVKWYKYHSGSQSSTIAAQRNYGIRKTKSDIVAFLDAGCNAGPHWLRQLTDPILTGDETITSGPVTPSKPGIYNDLAAPSGKLYLLDAPTANLAVHRAMFEKVGMYDTNFSYGSDVDWSWRARDAGFKIRRVNSASVTHDWGNLREQISREYRYGVARVYLYRKHVLRRRYIIRREPVMVAYTAYIIGVPLTILFPWYPLILLIPILKNIRHPERIKGVFLKLAYGWGVLSTLLGRKRGIK